MKTSKLRKLAWVFFALALTTTSVFAQGWRNTNGANLNQNNCLNSISGLSENQKSQILEMEEKHKDAMTEMRVSRRSASDIDKKIEIRDEMTKMVTEHRNAVKSVLNDEQQKQYDLLHVNSGIRNQQNFANCSGNGNFQGRRQMAGNKQFKGRNGNGRLYAQNNAACSGNQTRFSNRRMGRGNARFNQQGNFQRGNGRFFQQYQSNELNNQNIENDAGTKEETIK